MARIRMILLLLGALLALPPVAQAQDTVTYYHTDAIGSVRMITDANGGVLYRYDYLAFGVSCPAPQCASQQPDTRQFTGKERDGDTAFDYFGARYYASQTGRFTTVDPLLDVDKALIDPQRWNRYAYALNNPLKFVDPDGREPAITNRQLDFELPKWGYVAFGASTLAGAVVLAGPTAWRAVVGCFLSPSCQSSAIDILEGAAGGPPSVGGNIARLSEAELATGQRLAQRLGQAVRVSEHEGAEFVSAAGRTFDALGTPAAYKFWNEKAFLSSIDRHLRKRNDFTVIDLTGASRAQIDAIRRHVSSLASELQDQILFVGQ